VDDHVDGVQGGFEDGASDGPPCIVMEYVPAPTLADLLTDGRTLPPQEAARIGLGMVAALRAAHAAGILHRDVKPGNVLLGAEGRVVLTDFGIAMTADASTLTKTGEMVGSIHYMAPERIRGQRPGPASDLWALGATGDTAPNSEKSSATPSYSPSPVPQGFQLVTEKGLGVSFPVPDGWKAKKRTSGEVVYTDETGLVRLAIGFVDPAGSHPMAHFKDIEANTKVNYPTSYRKLRMQKTTFRGQPAAVWEFTFQGRARTFRAIDLGYGREGGREYDIYLSAPDLDWDTYRPTFDKVRDGFTVSARS
jgi:serine/threonine protein kinase